MTGNGMPDWGASGQGIWGVADDGSLISMEGAQFAFSNGISPGDLESEGFAGATIASGVWDNYTWVDGSGNSCTPGSGSGCWGIPINPRPGQNQQSSTLGGIETVPVTYDSSQILYGWGGQALAQLGNSLQSMLNSPDGMQAVNDLIGFSKSAKQIGEIASRAGATGAIIGAATDNPALFAAGVVVGGSGVVVTQIGSAAGLLGGTLQSVQQGSWAPFATSLIDFIEPDLNFSPLW